MRIRIHFLVINLLDRGKSKKKMVKGFSFTTFSPFPVKYIKVYLFLIKKIDICNLLFMILSANESHKPVSVDKAVSSFRLVFFMNRSE